MKVVLLVRVNSNTGICVHNFHDSRLGFPKSRNKIFLLLAPFLHILDVQTVILVILSHIYSNEISWHLNARFSIKYIKLTVPLEPKMMNIEFTLVICLISVVFTMLSKIKVIGTVGYYIFIGAIDVLWFTSLH